MPSLPPSPPASSSFTWAHVQFLVIFVVAVLGVSGAYLLALHISDKIAARRARVSDVEKAANATSVTVASKPKAPVANPKAAAAAAVLVAARAQLPVTVKSSLAPLAAASMPPAPSKKTPCALLVQLCAEDDGPTQFTPRKSRTLPGPSPLRAVCHAPEPVPVAAPVPIPIAVTVAFKTAANPKAAAAAAVLAAARAQLPVTVKSSLAPSAVVSMAPVLVKKTPCAVLLQLSAEDDAPTRFGGRKMRTLPGPSPLCAVCYASERMPVAATVPVPIVVPAAVPVTPVEPVSAPPIAVTLAHAIAAAYHSSDNEEDSASEYSDSDEDEDPSRFQVVPWIANSGVPVGAGSRSSLRAVNFPSYAPQHHSPGRSPRTRLLVSSSCNILQSHNVQHTSHTKPPAAKECLSPMTPKKTHHHRAVRIQKENSAARMKSPPRAFIV